MFCKPSRDPLFPVSRNVDRIIMRDSCSNLLLVTKDCFLQVAQLLVIAQVFFVVHAVSRVGWHGPWDFRNFLFGGH